MSYSLHLLKKMLLERGITNVLIVGSERNVNVGTEGHTDWDKLKGLEAREWWFDEDTYNKLSEHKTKQVNKPTVKTKPLYTALLGRWGK